MREKKGGALSRVQKLKKRLSHSFGRLGKYSFSLCVKHLQTQELITFVHKYKLLLVETAHANYIYSSKVRRNTYIISCFNTEKHFRELK